MKTSVLMAVYGKDSPVYLGEALGSLSKQTQAADQVVLVKDGPVPASIEDVIDVYASKLPLELVSLANNQGLAFALNEGLKKCAGEWIIRADSDDISLPNRIEQQLAFVEQHSELDAASSWIEERNVSMQQTLGIRKVPLCHEEIKVFAKRRSPLNHPAAIVRKRSLLEVGGYPLLRKAQDYALWSLMLSKGYHLANMPEILVWMRAGENLLDKRGREHLKNEFELIRYQRHIGFLGKKDITINIFVRALVRLSPSPIQRLMYKFCR